MEQPASAGGLFVVLADLETSLCYVLESAMLCSQSC